MKRPNSKSCKLKTVALLATALIGAPLVASRQHTSVPSMNWREIARSDVEAIDALIKDTHPAARPEIGDAQFLAMFARAKAIALGYAENATSEAGYRAAISSFAVGLGDPHIAARFSKPSATFAWPGFVVRYAGNRFVVGAIANPALPLREGDVLSECDGISASDLGEQRLGRFRAVWPLRAERRKFASLLLVDDGNPFLSRPRNCAFTGVDGTKKALELTWTAVEAQNLTQIIKTERERFGAADQQVVIKQDIAWIGMARMDQSADAMISSLIAERQDVVAAKAVIVDLRGNSGGDSTKGDRLVEALFTRPVLAKVRMSARYPSGGVHWRATARVLESIDLFAKERAETYGQDSEDARGWRNKAAQMRKDIAAGYAFSPRLPKSMIAADQPSPYALTPPPLAQKVFVLTDNICVSSCLMLVGRLKALGVRQFGWETNASRRYMEVRGFQLPSGLASFSTLQKVAFNAPNWMGPFVPEVGVPDRVTNAAELENWLRETVIDYADGPQAFRHRVS